MMGLLTLEFEGYFQDRMTTDPDPTDEKRGVSGYTFAFAGEPDLDNIVHCQPDEPGVCEREFGPAGGPKVGVTVRRALRDGVEVPELAGGKIAFRGMQIIEHNGILVRNDFFIVHPLHVTLTVGEQLMLDRVDDLNPDDPSMPPEKATGAQLQRRQPTTFTHNSQEVADATGLPSPANVALMENRIQRRKSLEVLLGQTTDPVKRAALDSRIEQLRILDRWWDLSVGTPTTRPIDRRAAQLALQLSGWNIDMNGKVCANALGADESLAWNIEFWFGGWDGDALCAYAKGTWTIPTR